MSVLMPLSSVEEEMQRAAALQRAEILRERAVAAVAMARVLVGDAKRLIGPGQPRVDHTDTYAHARYLRAVTEHTLDAEKAGRPSHP